MVGLHRARLTGKGQIQVPKAVREALNVGRGDDLVFRVEESGAVCVTRELKMTLSDLAGVLSPAAQGPPLGEEEDTAAAEAVERDKRVVREYRRRAQGVAGPRGREKE